MQRRAIQPVRISDVLDHGAQSLERTRAFLHETAHSVCYVTGFKVHPADHASDRGVPARERKQVARFIFASRRLHQHGCANRALSKLLAQIIWRKVPIEHCVGRRKPSIVASLHAPVVLMCIDARKFPPPLQVPYSSEYSSIGMIAYVPRWGH